jgi:hypothetical protein
MPLKKCSSGGKSGWKWGSSGKCYTGPGAKKKAIKQGVAIEGPEKFASKAIQELDISTIEDFECFHSECIAAVADSDISDRVLLSFELGSAFEKYMNDKGLV